MLITFISRNLSASWFFQCFSTPSATLFLQLSPLSSLNPLSPALFQRASLSPSQVSYHHYASPVCGQDFLLHILSWVPLQHLSMWCLSHHSAKTAFFEVLSKVLISNPTTSSWTACSQSLSALHTLLTTSSLWCGLPLWLRRQRISLQCGRPGFNP